MLLHQGRQGVLPIDEEAFGADAGAVNLGALPPMAGPQQMAEKPHMMRPERALALVGGRQECLRLLRGDERQGTIHAWPGWWARGRGQRHRGLERGHQREPFLLLGARSTIALRMPSAGGTRVRPAPGLRGSGANRWGSSPGRASRGPAPRGRRFQV